MSISYWDGGGMKRACLPARPQMAILEPGRTVNEIFRKAGESGLLEH